MATCTATVAFNYYEFRPTAGNWLCSMPGCDKHCYVEKDGRIHDYCSKTHAEEHKKMKGSSWLQMPWTSVSSSHHHGTQSRFTCGSSNPTPLTIGMHTTYSVQTSQLATVLEWKIFYNFGYHRIYRKSRLPLLVYQS